MSEPFVGEIRMFAGNFAPRNWAYCDGQLLAISQNDALFSLLGTIYGGDGRTTFALPDMRGRIPVHMGQGPGLSNRRIGMRGGAENVTLTTNQLPSHTHGPLKANGEIAGSDSPKGHVTGDTQDGHPYYGKSASTAFNAAAISNVGGNVNHTNVMPFLCVNFIISLYGIYPSRT